MRSRKEILLNPIRMQILQYLMKEGSATPGILTEVLEDVPRTTLYRHVNILHEEGYLKVVKEVKIRGTFEREYAVNEEKFDPVQTSGKEQQNTSELLLRMLGNFEDYYAKPDSDSSRDMIFFTENKLKLSDAEYSAFLQELFALIAKYDALPRAVGQKDRSVTMVSAPVPKEKKKKPVPQHVFGAAEQDDGRKKQAKLPAENKKAATRLDPIPRGQAEKAQPKSIEPIEPTKAFQEFEQNKQERTEPAENPIPSTGTNSGSKPPERITMQGREATAAQQPVQPADLPQENPQEASTESLTDATQKALPAQGQLPEMKSEQSSEPLPEPHTMPQPETSAIAPESAFGAEDTADAEEPAPPQFISTIDEKKFFSALAAIAAANSEDGGAQLMRTFSGRKITDRNGTDIAIHMPADATYDMAEKITKRML